MSNERVKFAICGIGRDLVELVDDHQSVERLLEEGAIDIKPMANDEISAIFERATSLYNGDLTFDHDVVEQIVELSDGYPYLAQLMGKACVNRVNETQAPRVDRTVFDHVLEDIRSGTAFPTLESAYLRAVGQSELRRLLLTILAEQRSDASKYNDDVQRVALKEIRALATEFEIDHIDQLVPRLIDKKFGPALVRDPDIYGAYEWANPVLRAYVRLRR